MQLYNYGTEKDFVFFRRKEVFCLSVVKPKCKVAPKQWLLSHWDIQRKNSRKYTKCSETLIKLYTATDTRSFTGPRREKEQCYNMPYECLLEGCKSLTYYREMNWGLTYEISPAFLCDYFWKNCLIFRFTPYEQWCNTNKCTIFIEYNVLI
jgi:hypothetical protein